MAMDALKKCTRCGVEKPATTEYFGPYARLKSGLSIYCRECMRQKRVLQYHKDPERSRRQAAKWKATQLGLLPPSVKAVPTHRRCYCCGIEHLLSAEFFHVNRSDWSGFLNRCKPCERTLGKKYRDANRDKYRAAAKRSYMIRQANPTQRLSARMSSRIYSCLTGTKRRRRWESLVGYSVHDLRKHLERQFTAGMSFDNYGEWHVDHIVPIAKFKFTSTDDADFKACWALTNLRPLWRMDNHRKHAIRTHLI